MSDRAKFEREVRWRVSGLPFEPFRDVYPRLMGASLVVTVTWAFGAYVLTAVVFACMFALEPSGVAGADTFTELLWFSVQTLSTIGYGGMTPETPFINLLVIVESFIGLAGVAVVTAILYAKFSLPEARVRFSNALAVHDYQGQPTLHLRIANERTTPVLDAEIQIGVLVDESDQERRFSRMYDLDLVRSRIPLFAMAFTAMHVLDDASPLRKLVDAERIRLLIVTFRGIDARSLQPVFTRAIFHQEQVEFGMGFDDMVDYDDEGLATLDLSRTDDLVPRTLTRAEN